MMTRHPSPTRFDRFGTGIHMCGHVRPPCRDLHPSELVSYEGRVKLEANGTGCNLAPGPCPHFSVKTKSFRSVRPQRAAPSQRRQLAADGVLPHIWLLGFSVPRQAVWFAGHQRFRVRRATNGGFRRDERYR